jgi:four helix bundle protein
MKERKNKVYDLRKRTYLYALDITEFLQSLPKGYISQVIGKQSLRSATSIGANIIEAQASSSKKDFANFYRHGLKSANESRFWLELIRDSIGMAKDEVVSLLTETIELSNILASSILTLREKRRSLLTFTFWFLLLTFYFLL